MFDVIYIEGKCQLSFAWGKVKRCERFDDSCDVGSLNMSHSVNSVKTNHQHVRADFTEINSQPTSARLILDTHILNTYRYLGKKNRTCWFIAASSCQRSRQSIKKKEKKRLKENLRDWLIVSGAMPWRTVERQRYLVYNVCAGVLCCVVLWFFWVIQYRHC